MFNRYNNGMKHFVDLQYNKQELERKLKSFPSDQQKRIQQARRLAEQYHAGQIREAEEISDLPYVIHCIRTALWLVNQKVTASDIITAMLLHDTLEDTQLTSDSIELQFGKRVLRQVERVTRERPDNETEEGKIKSKTIHMNKITCAPTETRLMKTADFLDNMRSWLLIPKNGTMVFKIPRWIREAQQHYIPIASTVAPQTIPEMEKIVTKIKAKFL